MQDFRVKMLSQVFLVLQISALVTTTTWADTPRALPPESDTEFSILPTHVFYRHPAGRSISIEIRTAKANQYLVSFEKRERGVVTKTAKQFGPEVIGLLMSDLKGVPSVLNQSRSDQGCEHKETWWINSANVHRHYCKTKAMTAKLDQFLKSVALILR